MDNDDPENSKKGQTPDNICSNSSIVVDLNDVIEQHETPHLHTDEIPINEQIKPSGQCTIKEIISEILDCTIVNKNIASSSGMQNTTERSAKTSSILFPPDSSEVAGCTMKEVISRILDCTVHPLNQSNFCDTTMEEKEVHHKGLAASGGFFDISKIAYELSLLEDEDNPFK